MRKRREKPVQDSSRGNFWAKKDEDIKAEIVVTRPEEARKRCSRPGVDTRLRADARAAAKGENCW